MKLSTIDAMKDLAEKEAAVAKSRMTLAKVLEEVNKMHEGHPVTEDEAFNTPAEVDETPAPEESKTKPSKKKAAKEIKIEDVREVLAELSQNGHTDAVREILNRHGAQKLSDVPEDDYEAVLEEASKVK